jgi:midasin (ATPase involved in ribosome maturation)
MVKKASNNYCEELMAAKVTINLHDKQNNDNNESIRNERQRQQQQLLEEEKKLLDKQKDLGDQIKEAEFLIEEGTNRLEKALKNGSLSETMQQNF